MAKEFDGKAITSLNNTLNLVGGRLIFDEKNALFISAGDDGNISIGDTLDNVDENSVNNIRIGRRAGDLLTTGNSNTYVGVTSAADASTGDANTALGAASLRFLATGGSCTALGFLSLTMKQDSSNNTDQENCTGVGADARASADNQVQLGDSSTTTFAYGAVQDRSDARDKADIKDSPLGLEFINKVRPVSFKWDMRDDYNEINKAGDTVRVPRDGSKKRSRLHYGVIAQELKAVMDDVGVDFGGYQDHSMSKGGCDVLSVGYTEFIGPLIKAVQELSAQNMALKKRIDGLE